MSITEEKLKAIEVFKAAFNKQYGSDSVRILGNNEVSNIPRLSSGIPSLDDAIGGGYPKGRITEIFGPESSGKTTTALMAIAECQKAGDVAAFIDVEHAFDPSYANALGVKIDELIFAQPDTAEEALDLVDQLSSSGIVSLIVLDSVAALVPKVELEGEMGDQQMGLQARLMSKACRKITGPASKNNVTIIMLNQIRSKVGFFMGSPDVTPGGNALKFFSSLRMEVRKTGTLKDDDIAVANETQIKVVKNKTAPPFRVVEFQIEFGKGVNKLLDLVRLATKKEVIQKSGAWYSFNGNKIGQGESNVCSFLEEHKDVMNQVINKLRG